MNTIIIDTSTDKSLVLFARGVDVLLKILLPSGAQSSRHLMTAIASGLEQLDLLPSALEAVAVAVGPGSYTGIRVGAAAAKGLAFPGRLPLVGFCSLEGFVSPHAGKFASLIDARIGGSYVLLQEREGDKITLLSPPHFISHEALPAYLDEWPERVGPHLGYPDPDHLARLVAHKLAQGSSSKELELLYLRTPNYSLDQSKIAKKEKITG